VNTPFRYVRIWSGVGQRKSALSLFAVASYVGVCRLMILRPITYAP
jgi:hypothetical protein